MIKVKYEGFAELAQFFGLRVGKVRQSQNALRKVAEKEVEAAQYRLKISKLSPDGQPWTPWAESTRRAREREGNAGLGLLYRSGRLADAFQININTNQVTIKNIAPYSTYLQDGTPEMPARPYLGWSKESEQRIQTIMSDFIKNTVVNGKDYK